jgi:hypothetical protein
MKYQMSEEGQDIPCFTQVCYKICILDTSKRKIPVHRFDNVPTEAQAVEEYHAFLEKYGNSRRIYGSKTCLHRVYITEITEEIANEIDE